MTPLQITLDEVALFVFCPICESGDVGDDIPSMCWEEDGSRELDSPHPERIKNARDELAIASRMLGHDV